jgi:hypothetical protein
LTKVVIDMSMSFDGFIAGPDDGKAQPFGRHGGAHVLDWYSSGADEHRHPLFRTAPGANRDEVDRMFAESGAYFRTANLRDRPGMGRQASGERCAEVRAHSQSAG